MSATENILEIVKTLTPKIEEILKSDKKWWTKIDELTNLIVPEVEVIGQEWPGADKKSLAMEIIQDLYFRYLDSKYIPNILESFLVRSVTSFLIEKAVKLFNKLGTFTHRTSPLI